MRPKTNPDIRGMAWCPVHDYDRWRCDKDCARQRLDASRAANALYHYFYDREMQARYGSTRSPQQRSRRRKVR